MQVTVLPVGDKFSAYAEKVVAELKAADIRAELSEATESLGKRIREAEMMKIPYVLVVGEKEETAGEIATRDGKTLKIKKFLEEIETEIKEKRPRA